MQMGWESISQLAGIRRQVHILLSQILNHRYSDPLIASVLSIRQLSPLSIAAKNRP